MVDFLTFGSESTSGKLPPLVPNTEPRGKASDEFLGLVMQERDAKEAQEQYWEDMANENDFGYMNYLGKTIAQESIAYNLVDVASDYAEEFDVSYDPSNVIDEDWPQWRKDAVMEAKNEGHAQTLIQRTEEQDLYNKEGQYHGGMGTALNLMGAVANPENFLLGVGEVAALTKLGLSGAKAVAAGATISALTNTAQEAVIIANNKSRSKLGLLTAAGFGAAFGAGGGLISNKLLKSQKALDDAYGAGLSNSWKHDLDIATGDVKVQNQVYRSPDAEQWFQAVKDGSAAVDVDGSYVVQMGNSAFKYNTKAQANAALNLRKQNIEPTPEAVTKQVEVDFDTRAAQFNKDFPARKGGWWSSLGIKGLSSKNPFTRRLFGLTAQDAAGTGGKQVATHSAALRGDMYAARMRSIWMTARHEASRDWKRANKQGNWKPWDNSAMAKFDDLVYREVAFRDNPKTRPQGHEIDPHIKYAADEYEKLTNHRLQLMKEKGVEGYTGDAIDIRGTFQSHKWDGISMSRMGQKIGDENVIKLIAKGIMNGGEFARKAKYAKLGEKLTEDYKQRTSLRMAEAIFKRFTRRPDTVDIARSNWMTKQDKKGFEETARRFIEDEVDLKHLLTSADPKDSRAANELLSRIELDVNSNIDGVNVRDFMNRDLGASMDTEIRRSAGKAAMAELGFRSSDDFFDATEEAAKWNRLNRPDLDEQGLKRLNREDQMLWNMMLGENLESDADSAVARYARMFRKFTTLASLNQVGFAQLAESGRLMGAIGVKAYIRQIPEYGRMIKRMKNGTFKDPMLNDIEAAFGLRIGDNHLLNNPTLLAESGGVDVAAADAKGFMQGMQVFQNNALHSQGYINGMNYMMQSQHKMHARGLFMRMYEDFHKANIPAHRLKRYADMGLSEADIKSVRKQMDKHTEMGEGWFGQNRPINMHMVNYDSGIREKLALAFHKSQSNAIQRQIGGETHWWMESTFGKLLSQFRTFPIVAIEKQLIHDAKFGFDPETLITTMGSLGFAALAYTVKTHGNSFGLPAKKRKQYLKNRLTPDKIFAGASAWSGQAAIVPDVMRSLGDIGFDNPWAWSHGKGMAYRDYSRGKDLDVAAVAGPAGAWMNNAYRFASGVGHVALSPTEFNPDVFKYPARTIPFANSFMLKPFFNATLE